MSKKKSAAEKFADLLDPTPKFQDPEDVDDETVARLTSGATGADDVVTPSGSKLRQKTAALLSDSDKRYAGKKVSRKNLDEFDVLDDDELDDYTPRKDDEQSRGRKSRDVTPSDEGSEMSSELDHVIDTSLARKQPKFDVGAMKDFAQFADEDMEEGESDDEEVGDSEDELTNFKTMMKKKPGGKKNKTSADDSEEDEDSDEFDEELDDDDDIEEDDDDEDEDDDDDDAMSDDDYNLDERIAKLSADLQLGSAGKNKKSEKKPKKGESESDEDEDEDDDDEEEDSDEDEEGGVKQFSRQDVDDEVQKGKGAKAQLGLWDSFLEMRIRLQKSVSGVNQLPLPGDRDDVISQCGDELSVGLAEVEGKVKKLMSKLVHLQTSLLVQNPDTRGMVTGDTTDAKPQAADDDDEEIPSDSDVEEERPQEPSDGVKQALKRKLKTSEYPEFLAKRHKGFQQYRNDTIQKWYDKTRVATGKVGKGFGAFDQSALKQIEQVLSDKDRLLKRTQLRRSGHVIIGQHVQKPEETPAEKDEEEFEDRVLAKDALKDYEPEIFDDDDFYHQLLRELIERKTTDVNDPIALSRHWLEIQKLRNKSKKKVDTKASKGRKIRHNIHKPLVNFMAPAQHSPWTDEAISELYRSLFGKGGGAEPENGS